MQEIRLAVDEFNKDPSNTAIQQKILELARSLPDASELIRGIMETATSLISEGGPRFATSSVFDLRTGLSQRGPEVRLSESQGPLGKLHTEHLYFVAKCIGCANRVDDAVLNHVIKYLLSEFDLEVTFPQAAIQAFGDIGERAIPALMAYLKDQTKETFSREDAALALGVIGRKNDRVVEELTRFLDEADYNDMAMPLYALGETRNPRARAPIVRFMQSYPNHPKTWVAQQAFQKIPDA